MYEKRLGDAGYLSYKLGRTNNRGDGIIFYNFCESFLALMLFDVYVAFHACFLSLCVVGDDRFAYGCS